MTSGQSGISAPTAISGSIGWDTYAYIEDDAGTERGWQEYGRRVAGNRQRLVGDGSQQMWCVGDWLIAGQDRVFGNLTRARVREMAEELTGYSRNTLRMAAAVARQFAPDMRINGLTWWHHLAVLGLDPGDRERLLIRSAEEEWSVDVLRTEVRRVKGPAGRRRTSRTTRLIRQVTQLSREDVDDELLAELRDWVHRQMAQTQKRETTV